MTAPATKPSYQANAAPLYGSPSYAPLMIAGFIDPGDTSLDPAGKPTPVGPTSPMPVSMAGGLSGTVQLGAGSATVGAVQQAGLWTVSLATGTAVSVSGGQVTVSGAVSLIAGTAAIGNVGVSSLPSLPAGTNAIGTVSVSGGSVAATVSGSVAVTTLPSLPAGTALIGAVNLDVGGTAVSTSNPVPASITGAVSLAAGTAAIGTVSVSGAASLPLPAGAAQDGTDASGVTPLNGGVGLRGWTSGTYFYSTQLYGLANGSGLHVVSATGTALATAASQAPLTTPGTPAAQGQTSTVVPASTTAATDANRLAVTTPDLGVFSASATSAAVFAQVDTSGFSSVAVQLTAAGTGCTVVFEASNDQSTWISAFGVNPAAALASPLASLSAAGVLLFPVGLRYFRARVSVYGSGTVTMSGYLRGDVVPQLDPQTSARIVQARPILQARTALLASSVATGGTAVQIVAAGGLTQGYMIQNPASANEPIYVDNVAGTCVIGSATAFAVLPGQSYSPPVPPSGAVWVNAATSGHAFVGEKY